MSYRSEKIKKALEAKGYTDVKVWWEPLGKALEMCGPSGGWMFSWTERDEDILGYNLKEALKSVERLDKIEYDDDSYTSQLCECGHKRLSHSENGCEAFINDFIGDCPCAFFVKAYSE